MLGKIYTRISQLFLPHEILPLFRQEEVGTRAFPLNYPVDSHPHCKLAHRLWRTVHQSYKVFHFTARSYTCIFYSDERKASDHNLSLELVTKECRFEGVISACIVNAHRRDMSDGWSKLYQHLPLPCLHRVHYSFSQLRFTACTWSTLLA
jgi:hypothetical protein